MPPVVLPTPSLSNGFLLTCKRLPLDDWRAQSFGSCWEWALRGPAGTITLIAGRHQDQQGRCHRCRHREEPLVDQAGWCWGTFMLNRHSSWPTYEAESPMRDGGDCEYVTGPCYSDGSPWAAERVMRDWFKAGESSEALSRELHETYTYWLGERRTEQ